MTIAYTPEISVVITCLNEEQNIRACLQSVQQQTYSGEFEIVVVDGGSTDNTVAIIEGVAGGMDQVRLVVETKKGTAAGRNGGVRASKAPLIAFIDADCEAPPEWLALLNDHFQQLKKGDETLVAVGGTNLTPKGSEPFLEAIGLALDSYAGSFNSTQGRQFEENRQVASLATLNVLYDKQKLQRVGCFDESLASEAEDADLNYRLGQAGFSMYFIAQSFVYHKMRPTPKMWLKNMFRYGKGRARLLKRYPAMWNLSFILPLIFGMVMGAVVFTPLFIWAGLGLFYFPCALLFSLWQATRKSRMILSFHVYLVYLIQHFGYASGEIYGLLDPRVK